MSGVEPSVCTTTDRKARKEHTCCECGGTIKPGDTYQHVKGIWEGKACEHKTCEPCATLRGDVESLTPYRDEWPAFGELGEECDNYGGEYEARFAEIKRRAQQAKGD